jgi:hypothetical protein
VEDGILDFEEEEEMVQALKFAEEERLREEMVNWYEDAQAFWGSFNEDLDDSDEWERVTDEDYNLYHGSGPPWAAS